LIVWNPWATYTGTDPKLVAQRVKHIEMLRCKGLFIPSRLSKRQSMKSSVGVSLQGRCMEKVTLLLNGSHLEP
jgi:hypothetical protein